MSLTEKQRRKIFREYKKEKVIKERHLKLLEEYDNFYVIILSDRDTDELTAVLTSLGVEIFFPELDKWWTSGEPIFVFP